MIRILQVYPQLNNAGTERVILNLYENINRNEIQFDFLVESPGEMDEYISSLGAKIYYIKETNKKVYYDQLVKFFENHEEYKVVHTHTHARMSVVLKAAKKSGVKCRVAHSHNARNDLPKIAWFIKGLSSIPIELYSTHFFSCSSNAAKWLFPHKYKECKIIHNGIFINKYLFNEKDRCEYRKHLNINDNEFVFIHVGRFAKQKNHSFLISLLNEYNKISDNNWKAILIGEGPLQKEIKELVSTNNLEDKIIFLGNRNDVEKLLNCADCFVFPSLHEGLGIVVIEAQANSLPCIVSNAVPMEADLNIGVLHRLSLNDSKEKWIEMISGLNVNLDSRKKNKNYIIASDYNIESVASFVSNFYKEVYHND